MFRSNMGSWLHSIFFSFSCDSLYVFRSSPLVQFLLCRFLHLCLSRRRRRCLGRNLCWGCFPLQFRLQSFCGFLFLPHHHPSRPPVVCHSLVLFPPCCSMSSSCISFSFVRLAGAFCAESIVSFFRVRLSRSTFQKHSSASERSPC